jgi:hypothetical protein
MKAEVVSRRIEAIAQAGTPPYGLAKLYIQFESGSFCSTRPTTTNWANYFTA